MMASINTPGKTGGDTLVRQINIDFQWIDAMGENAPEESSTVVCPLCRDTVPRSKPQCTSVAFCNSMPVRKAPL